jgi:hypothetical protein
MKRDFVFAYGSLLNPQSLRRTLPDIEFSACVPARAYGFVRTWSVAFPNDGSQLDKSYRDADGRKPDVVLFVNLESAVGSPATAAAANGILVPVTVERIRELANRERRYQLEYISASVEVYPGFESEVDGESRVAAFVGRTEFTRAEEVERGVISREYKNIIEDGVVYWDERVVGFGLDFAASTIVGSEVPVVPLTRIDHR